MLLLWNGRLLTRDPAMPWREDGAVLMEGGVIRAVGTAADLRAEYPAAELLDAGGGVIMPGLINAHAHIYSSFARGLSLAGYAARDFMEVLHGMWWRLDRALTNADTHHSAMAAYADCIKNGVTTVFDHHASYGGIDGSLFALSEAAAALGVRTCLCYEVSDRDGPDKMRAAVGENEAFLAASKDNPMQAGMMGLHAAFTLSDATLDYCRARTPDWAGAHIHVAEGMGDISDSLRRYGKRIVTRLWERGILGEKALAVHCVHVSPEEIAILKETGTMVVHNPESNMGNAVGCGPVPALFSAGVLLGLGTDGYTHDMIESYKVGNLIHKHHLRDVNAAWAELPAMLFENNAKIAARYFDTPLGVLRPGAAADVIVADYDPPTPMDETNANAHILFGMTGRHITTTIIDGKIKMQNRVLTCCDESKLWADARAQAADFWKRVNA